MSAEYVADVSEQDGLALIDILRSESPLALVSYGERAVDLQLPSAVSPHEVHLDANYAEGRLRLLFHMAAAECEQQRDWLVQRARARGIELRLEAAQKSK